MISNPDKKLKIICSLVILFAIALMPLAGISDSSAQAAETPQFQVAPLSPDFLEFWENPPEHFYGYVPPTVDLSHLREIPVERMKALATVPSKFDWRDQGKVTPVRDQTPCGTCWVHGTLAAIESKVLKEESVAYNFSEQNLACCTDLSWVYLIGDRCNGGGNSFMVTDTLAKKGTRLESCQKYHTLTINTEACKDSCPTIKRITGYRLVADSPNMIVEVKNAIQNHGPVSMVYRHADGHMYDGSIYYLPGCTQGPTHLVCIVGWDDGIAHPQGGGSGAWIVKNSWGTGWGDNGYFYLCYGSANMQQVGYFEYEGYDPKEQVYYWDEAGLVREGGFGDNSAWMASIFTSRQDGSLSNVDFWTTSNSAQYKIYVYRDGNISDGLQNQVAFQTGACQELGYYSIPLSTPVSLTNGQQFTIAIKMTTPGYDKPIPGEKVIAGKCAPPIQPGVCFVRHTDTSPWADAASSDYNVCLRAKVTSGAPNNPPQLSNPSVQPPSGTPSTNFYYYVNYHDSDGDSPSVKRVYIDGMPYTMRRYSGSASNGIYRYGPKNLPVGSHNYYFYFSDGKVGIARLPTSGSYSGPTVSQVNNPPDIPSNPLPPNHAPNVFIPANLSWAGGDPDPGDTVTYDVYFGTSSPPPFKETIGPYPATQSSITYDPGALSYGTQYYWYIVATDNHSATTTGPVWDFTTVSPPSPGELHVGPGQPYATIQAAINAASDADTIIVHEGTYDAFTVENKNALSIMGQDGVTVNSAKNYPDWSCSIMAVAMNSTAIHIEDIVFDGEGIEENVVEGICYVNSTGSIIDVTMRNIVGTGEGSMGMGIFVGGGEIGTVDISGVTIENVTNGIMIRNDEVHIKDCTIDGEAITDLGEGIFAMDNAKVTIEDSRIINWRGTGYWDSQEAQSIGIGIGFQRGYGPMATSTAEITGCTIENNIGGISVDSDGRATVNYNNIMGNEFGVINLGEIPVDATNNWWGDASGPYNETTNPDGKGDGVSDNVNYNPWLDSPVSATLAYYRGLGLDPNVVETTDLLKAINDWANGTIPPGFSQAITTTQLLQLISEWAMGA